MIVYSVFRLRFGSQIHVDDSFDFPTTLFNVFLCWWQLLPLLHSFASFHAPTLSFHRHLQGPSIGDGLSTRVANLPNFVSQS